MVKETKSDYKGKKNLYVQNFQKFKRNFPFFNDIPEGIHVFKSEGFLDLIIHVIKKEENKILLDIAHYFKEKNKNGYELCYPDPHIETIIDLKHQTITAISFRNTIAKTSIYNIKGEEIQAQKNDLNTFLNSWLDNIFHQVYKIELNHFKWKRQPQERDENYLFNGKIHFTANVLNELSPKEMLYIILDVKGFAKANNGCDYLQIYEKERDKIYCIDQLSKEMLEGTIYTEEEKRKYNYFTVMFNYEY